MKIAKSKITKPLIITVLIVAILVATVVPALYGYQRSVTQLGLFNDCKDIRITATEYAAKLYQEYGSVDGIDAYANVILQESGHAGRISGTILCEEPAKVTYFAWTTTSGQTIVYSNGSYLIGETGVVCSARALTEQVDAMQEETGYLLSSSESLSQLREAVSEKNGGEVSLSDGEKKLLGDRQYRENWCWSVNGASDEEGDETFVLSAQAPDSDATVLLYFDGTYYLPASGETTLPDTGFDVTALEGEDWVEVELI